MKQLFSRLEQSSKGHTLVQFVKFGLVGLTNTALSWITTFVVILIVGDLCGLHELVFGGFTIRNFDANLGNFVGFIVGVINSFLLNKRYVFKDKQEQSEKKAFAKTFICYGATFLLSMVLMNLLLEVAQLHVVLFDKDVSKYVATMLRLLITIPLNFIANKLWAFRDRKPKEDVQ